MSILYRTRVKLLDNLTKEFVYKVCGGKNIFVTMQQMTHSSPLPYLYNSLFLSLPHSNSYSHIFLSCNCSPLSIFTFFHIRSLHFILTSLSFHPIVGAFLSNSVPLVLSLLSLLPISFIFVLFLFVHFVLFLHITLQDSLALNRKQIPLNTWMGPAF